MPTETKKKRTKKICRWKWWKIGHATNHSSSWKWISTFLTFLSAFFIYFNAYLLPVMENAKIAVAVWSTILLTKKHITTFIQAAHPPSSSPIKVSSAFANDVSSRKENNNKHIDSFVSCFIQSGFPSLTKRWLKIWKPAVWALEILFFSHVRRVGDLHPHESSDRFHFIKGKRNAIWKTSRCSGTILLHGPACSIVELSSHLKYFFSCSSVFLLLSLVSNLSP